MSGTRHAARTVDASAVDHDTVTSFRVNGAVVVRGLFTPDEVATVERGIERNLADPSPLFLVASREDDPGRFVEDFCSWQRIPEFEDIAFTSRAADAAAALMQSGTVRLFHDHVLVKEPGTAQETPWHQDQPYYNVDGVPELLDVDAGRPRAGRVDAGVPRRLAPRRLAHAALVHGQPGQVVPRGHAARAPDDRGPTATQHQILGWALEPGDVVFFHMLTVHHAYGVPGAHRRRAFSLRFLGDDADARAAAVAHVAAVRGARGRAARGRTDGPPPVPAPAH